MTEIFENIRQLYTFRQPCAELSAHIEFFSESSLEETFHYTGHSDFSIKMFPSWTPTMYINLGAAYQITIGQRKFHISPGQGILILRNTVVERHNTPADHIFTVKFHPGSLEVLLGIPQKTLAGKVVDLATILPTALVRNIRQAALLGEKAGLMETYLLKQARRQKDHACRFVQQAIELYLAAGMQHAIGEMAGGLAVSDKTFNRNFQRVIGTPPKPYLSGLRARSALSAYVNNRKSFTPSAYGYFDMSHFYKDVSGFTGEKLSEIYYR